MPEAIQKLVKVFNSDVSFILRLGSCFSAVVLRIYEVSQKLAFTDCDITFTKLDNF